MQNNSNIKLNAMKKGKKIKIFSNVHIVCKKTRSEASDFYNQYSKTKQDTLAVNSFINNLEWSKKVVLASYLKQVKQKISGSLGGYTIIGTKNAKARGIVKLSTACKAATKASAKINPGTAKKISVILIITSSTLPPKYPLILPMIVPIITVRVATVNPMVRETLEPYRILLNRS